MNDENRFGIQSMPSASMRKKRDYFSNNYDVAPEEDQFQQQMQLQNQPPRTQSKKKKNINPMSFLNENTNENNEKFRKLPFTTAKKVQNIQFDDDRDQTPIMPQRKSA